MQTRSRIAILIVLSGAIGLATLGYAQSGTRTSPPPRSTTVRSEAPFEERLWSYLLQAQYRNWAPLPGVTGDAYDGNSPHGAKVRLYVNRTAAAGDGQFPAGSILMKENYDASGTKLMAVTVMYRSAGYAPESGDWHWTKYEADGSVALMSGQRVTGKVGMCIDCHRSAGGGDYVFANDR